MLQENGSDDVLLWILMFCEKKVFAVNPFDDYKHVEEGENTSLDFVSMKESVEEMLSVVRTENLLKDYTDLLLFEKAALERIRKYELYIDVNENWESIITHMEELCRLKRNIAVYGYGVLGKRLLSDLEDKGVKISFVIDKAAANFTDAHYRIYEPEKIPGQVDLISFRYLVDMNLRRGMFIDRLLYRYRRDNAASSTYNPRFGEFNLAECRYIRKRMGEEGLTDRARRAFMARETVMMALSPYTTYREHSQPDGRVSAALDAFRGIISQDRKEGLLRQQEMPTEQWIDMRLFTEKPEAYEDYVAVKAKTRYDIYGEFVREMASKGQIVVFCTGRAAKFALCLMRMNRLDNTVAVCDSNSEKWGSVYHGHEILSPGEAVKLYPHAHYLIANRRCPEEIAAWLENSGISRENMSVYRLPLSAFGSTNLFMRGLQQPQGRICITKGE